MENWVTEESDNEGGRVREPGILGLTRTCAVASGRVSSARMREGTFWAPGV